MTNRMSAAELRARLAVLGIPVEVSGTLTLGQLRGIFMTLADFFVPEPKTMTSRSNSPGEGAS